MSKLLHWFMSGVGVMVVTLAASAVFVLPTKAITESIGATYAITVDQQSSAVAADTSTPILTFKLINKSNQDALLTYLSFSSTSNSTTFLDAYLSDGDRIISGPIHFDPQSGGTFNVNASFAERDWVLPANNFKTLTIKADTSVLKKGDTLKLSLTGSDNIKLKSRAAGEFFISDPYNVWPQMGGVVTINAAFVDVGKVDLKINDSDGPIDVDRNSLLKVTWTSNTSSCKANGSDVKVVGGTVWTAESNLLPNGDKQLLAQIVSSLDMDNLLIGIECSSVGSNAKAVDKVVVHINKKPILDAVPINVVSPNGGEEYTVGQNIMIKWVGGKKRLQIALFDPARTNTIVGGLLGYINSNILLSDKADIINEGSFEWNSSKVCDIQGSCQPISNFNTDKFQILLMSEDSNGNLCMGGAESISKCNYDLSDKVFIIKTPVKAPSCSEAPNVVKEGPLGNPGGTGEFEKLGLDISKHPEIMRYRIQWFSGAWSPWYVPGVGDEDWKVNIDGTRRRVWSYFDDHNHEFEVCKINIVPPVVVKAPSCSVTIKVIKAGPLGNPGGTGEFEKLGLDTSKHPEIMRYRIQWFSGAWSPWYVPGVGDEDSKTNLDGTRRRMWSYFDDHNHESEVCSSAIAVTLPPRVIDYSQDKAISSTIQNEAGSISNGNIIEIVPQSNIDKTQELLTKTQSIISKMKTLQAELNQLTPQIEAVKNFIALGTTSTERLSVDDRAAVVANYKTAFGKVPRTTQEWQDVVNIANNKAPTQVNVKLETQAAKVFQKVYKRQPNQTKNVIDDKAVEMIAYGIMPAKRDLRAEQMAVGKFMSAYRRKPSTSADWNAVRAIAYSGVEK